MAQDGYVEKIEGIDPHRNILDTVARVEEHITQQLQEKSHKLDTYGETLKKLNQLEALMFSQGSDLTEFNALLADLKAQGITIELPDTFTDETRHHGSLQIESERKRIQSLMTQEQNFLSFIISTYPIYATIVKPEDEAKKAMVHNQTR